MSHFLIIMMKCHYLEYHNVLKFLLKLFLFYHSSACVFLFADLSTLMYLHWQSILQTACKIAHDIEMCCTCLYLPGYLVWYYTDRDNSISVICYKVAKARTTSAAIVAVTCNFMTVFVIHFASVNEVLGCKILMHKMKPGQSFQL